MTPDPAPADQDQPKMAAIPGFKPLQEEPIDDFPQEEVPQDPSPSPGSPPSNPTPPPTPPPSNPDARGTQGAPTEVDEEAKELGGMLFFLAAAGINKFAKMRTKRNTTAWLATEEEADAFGTAAGRLAMRHVPEQFKTGEAGDVIVMTGVAVGYGIRNLGQTVGEARAADVVEARVSEAPRAAPQQAQPAPEPSPQTGVGVQAPAGQMVGPVRFEGIDTEAPGPTDPSLIDPGI